MTRTLLGCALLPQSSPSQTGAAKAATLAGAFAEQNPPELLAGRAKTWDGEVLRDDYTPFGFHGVKY